MSRCAKAAAQDARQTEELCLGEFLLTGDPAAGARVARVLAGRKESRWLVEAIALWIGDHPAGANTWAVVGKLRTAAGYLDDGIAAYRRATAHRAEGDLEGRIEDALGLAAAYLPKIEPIEVITQLAIAIKLAEKVAAPQLHVRVAIDLSSRLLQIGDVHGARNAIVRAKRYGGDEGEHRGELRAHEGILDALDGQWLSARQALLDAIAIGERERKELHVWAWRINLIEAETKLRNLDEAAALVEQVKRMKSNVSSAIAYYEALLRLERKELPAAVQVLEAALADAAHWNSSDRPTLQALLGRVQIALGDHEAGARSLTEAIVAYELQRDKFGLDTFKSSMLAKRRQPFEDLFQLRFEQQRDLDTLDIAERMKARSMLDGLVVLHSEARPATIDVDATGRRLESVRRLVGLLRTSPTTKRPRLDAVIEQLRGTTVVTYVRAGDVLYAVAIREDGDVRTHKIGELVTVAEKFEQWRDAPLSERTADELGKLLLPDELLPPPGRPIFIVPDEPVADVPFAALRKHGMFVVDRHPIGYAPSATILALQNNGTPARRAVVIGDPSDDRAGARIEALEVARTLEVDAAVGKAATMATVLGAGDAEVLHVASHAGAGPDGPFLRMSDRDVLGNAIVERRVATRLVVLTGCSSAHAANARDEFGSLAAAFLAAGAQTVIASRIDVDDAVARRFAQLFYAAGGLRDPVSAVAAAQRQLRREGVSPVQWSTFMVFGGLRAPTPL